jgi:hypothetical protein
MLKHAPEIKGVTKGNIVTARPRLKGYKFCLPHGSAKDP